MASHSPSKNVSSLHELNHRMASPIKIPEFKLTVNGQASDGLKGHVAHIIVEDHEHGRADNAEILLQDVRKLWAGAWKPKRGDTVKVELGYKGDALADFGTFEVDELVLSAPPNTLLVKVRSAFPSRAFQQQNSVNYVDVSLTKILHLIAAHHSMKAEFDGKDVQFESITQYRESDLHFLVRVAELYGFIFKITDKKLILYARKKIEEQSPVATLKEGANHEISLRETSLGEMKTARAVWYDTHNEKVLESTEASENKTVATDELRLYDLVENLGQSQRIAEAARRWADKTRTIGRIIAREHQNVLQAGVTLRLEGYLSFDGVYFIEYARHVMTGVSHYETELYVRKIKD